MLDCKILKIFFYFASLDIEYLSVKGFKCKTILREILNEKKISYLLSSVHWILMKIYKIDGYHFCFWYYRTLHSYNLIWAVCHLFPQQRWWTLTYSVLGNHWPGEPRDLRKTTSARKFRPAFGATSKTRIFYKYVVFKHSSSFYTNSSQWIHCLSSYYSSTRVKSKKMDKPHRHPFLQYTLSMRPFPVSEKPTVSNHKKKDFSICNPT